MSASDYSFSRGYGTADAFSETEHEPWEASGVDCENREKELYPTHSKMAVASSLKLYIVSIFKINN